MRFISANDTHATWDDISGVELEKPSTFVKDDLHGTGQSFLVGGGRRYLASQEIPLRTLSS